MDKAPETNDWHSWMPLPTMPQLLNMYNRDGPYDWLATHLKDYCEETTMGG